MSTFRGRELIYPGPFGDVTAGGDKDYPVDYSHLNIQGYALGANGLPEGVAGDPDHALFPKVSTETEYGWDKKVKMSLPVYRGARLDGDRPEKLGALRRRRGDLGRDHRLRRKRLRYRPGPRAE
jgi:hypothetical protein